MVGPEAPPTVIWAVYAEGSESRDELPELFTAFEKSELESIAECYEAPILKYVLEPNDN